MPRVRALVAAGAVTLASGLAACGGSSPHAAPPDPAAVLTRAYTQTVAARSADLALSIKERVAGRVVDISGTGAFDWGARRGGLTMSVHVAGQDVSVQEVLAGGAIYAKFPPQVTRAIGVSAPWIKIPVSTSTSTSSALSAGPDQTLQLLASQSSGVTRVGPATVDGVATTEYTASIDPTKAAQDLPSGLRVAFSRAANRANLTVIPITAYVDSAGRAVRLTSTVTITTPASASAGGSSATVTTDEQIDVSRYGAPVAVTVPPASQVGSSSALTGLFGS